MLCVYLLRASPGGTIIIVAAIIVPQEYPKIFEIKFNSTNKYQIGIHDNRKDGDERPLLVMKVGGWVGGWVPHPGHGVARGCG